VLPHSGGRPRGMRTLFAKILLWFWCTLAISVVGSAFISALIVNRNASGQQSPAARLVALQLTEARNAYERGGRPGLEAFLEDLQKIYGAKGILTDEEGHDLLTNENRGDLIRRARRRANFPIIRTTENMLARRSEDGRYWFFFIVPMERPGSWFLTP